MEKNKHYLWFIAAVVLAIGVFVVNRWIMRSLEPSLVMPSTVFEKKVEQHPLIPSDPRQYQVRAYANADTALTQEDWNQRLGAAKLKGQVRTATGALGVKKVETKTTKIGTGKTKSVGKNSTVVIPRTSSTDLERKLQMLDLQIKRYERAARNPKDLKSRQELQTLYMLRATLLGTRVENK